MGGRDRGRRLKTRRGEATRPTAGRVRQTLFDIIGPEVPGSRFLDAFAGNGAVGLEALSRGAARVVLVEKSREAAEVARVNAETVGRGADVRVFRQDVQVAVPALAGAGERFDIVYVDPPYESELYEPVLQALGSSSLVPRGGLVVAEHFHKRPLPETMGSLVCVRSVRVGDHRLTFYRRQEDEPA